MSNHIVKGRNQTANTTNIIYHLNTVKQLITQPPMLKITGNTHKSFYMKASWINFWNYAIKMAQQ